MKLNIRELTFIGFMGLLMFLLSFLLGNTLTLLIPIPGISGLTNLIIHGIIIAILLLVIRKFWVATILWCIYGLLSIPTNLMAGLPGLYKLMVAIIVGIIIDTVVYVFKYKTKGIYFSMIAMAIVESLILLWLYVKLSVPGTDFFINYWPIVIVLFAILMCLGSFIGIKIFYKLKNKRVIKLIKE